MKKEFIYQLIIGVLVLIIFFLCLRTPKSNEIGRYQRTDGGFLDTKEGIACFPVGENWVIWDLKKIRPKNKQIETVINKKGDFLR